MSVLPERLIASLRAHVERLRELHAQDRAAGLLGHESVETTQIYTHVMRKPGVGVRSLLDAV